ncbi:MAG TPA: UDP-N-acetylglucosamine 1-carboxyvinyltransferase [Candidatus Saccharimonadia bacterium]|nr:UDP-N-acetylglucosamine 1-carboxyvinyltransferase [Candidatus Saccharimonadia bacterium]
MNKTLHIRGGKPLSGTVRTAGAKNAATKMMIASLLTDEPVILENCPQIEDVSITAEICSHVGATTRRDGMQLTLHTPRITSTKVTGLSRKNRISILALSPLLHRKHEAEVPTVGGDAIGPRPVNFHLHALERMGAVIEQVDHVYRATAPHGLHGTTITLPYPSVGATENIILAAVLAEGRTRIENAAVEPELVDIVKLLQQMGAIIEFGANRTVTIDGVKKLHGAHYRILPDRLEAASWANVALATDGEIMVEEARQDEMISFLNTVRRIGGDYEVTETGIRFRRANGGLHGIELETDTYPGFATDYQQPTVVVLTQAQGLSVVHETVYEDRFGYTEDLRRMGADIGVYRKCLGELPCRFRNQSEPHSAVIRGATPLHGAEIEIPDIRAGMAQVIAALVADGESRLTGIHHLERGYGVAFWDKLRAIGADFEVR